MEEIEDQAVKCKHCASWQTDEKLLWQKAKDIGTEKIETLKKATFGIVDDIKKSLKDAQTKEDQAETRVPYKVLSAMELTSQRKQLQLDKIIKNQQEKNFRFIVYQDSLGRRTALFSNRAMIYDSEEWNYQIVREPFSWGGGNLEEVKNRKSKEGWDFVYFQQEGGLDELSASSLLVMFFGWPIAGLAGFLIAESKIKKIPGIPVRAAVFRKRKRTTPHAQIKGDL